MRPFQLTTITVHIINTTYLVCLHRIFEANVLFLYRYFTIAIFGLIFDTTGYN